MADETQKKEDVKKEPEAKESVPKAKVVKKKKTPTAAKKQTKKAVKKKEVEPASPKEDKKPAPEKSKPLTFTQEAKKPAVSVKKKSKSRFGLVFLGLLAVIILFLGWYQTNQLTRQSKQDTSELRENVDSEVTSLKERLQSISDELMQQKQKNSEQVFTVYRNEALGISFQYPQDFGDVNEEEVSNENTGAKTTSSLVTLTFSKNPDLWVVAAKGDVNADDPMVYAGGKSDLAALCEDPLSITEKGYCDQVTVAGQPTTERVIVLGDKTVEGIVKNVPLNLSGAYSGLTINLTLGLPPVAGRNLFAPQSDDEQDAALEEFLRNLVKKEHLSLITSENLKAFEKIAETLEVIK